MTDAMLLQQIDSHKSDASMCLRARMVRLFFVESNIYIERVLFFYFQMQMVCCFHIKLHQFHSHSRRFQPRKVLTCHVILLKEMGMNTRSLSVL